MNTLGKRLKDATTGLSPEEKARLAIEDIFRGEPVLPSPERHRLLDAMSNEEGRRYNAVLARYETTKRHVTVLSRLVDALREQLLLRDRILWFQRALLEAEDRLLFEPTTGRALLVDNPNLKPGQPLILELTLASMKLGVWGRKRCPVGKATGVELHDRIIEALEIHARRIRDLAADVKAVYRHIVEESQELGLGFIAGYASLLVDQVSGYDRLLPGKAEDGALEGVAKWDIGECIFPVERRWALIWQEVEENAETARRIREDPEDWWPSAYDHDRQFRDRFLEMAKERARTL